MKTFKAGERPESISFYSFKLIEGQVQSLNVRRESLYSVRCQEPCQSVLSNIQSIKIAEMLQVVIEGPQRCKASVRLNFVKPVLF